MYLSEPLLERERLAPTHLNLNLARAKVFRRVNKHKPLLLTVLLKLVERLDERLFELTHQGSAPVLESSRVERSDDELCERIDELDEATLEDAPLARREPAEPRAVCVFKMMKVYKVEAFSWGAA